MAARRRLSQASKASVEWLEADDELDFNEDENDKIVAAALSRRRVSGGGARRRSSFGGVLSILRTPTDQVSREEQNRIAEMYKHVIQMSSENVSKLFLVFSKLCVIYS